MQLSVGLALALAQGASAPPAFLDRVEGSRAVLLERGRTRSVPRSTLAPGAREGAVVLKGVPDQAATRRLRRELSRKRAAVRWTVE